MRIKFGKHLILDGDTAQTMALYTVAQMLRDKKLPACDYAKLQEIQDLWDEVKGEDKKMLTTP